MFGQPFGMSARHPHLTALCLGVALTILTPAQPAAAQTYTDHRICSSAGFRATPGLPAYISSLIFAGVDIEACAEYLQLIVVDNFLLINFVEFDALLEAGRLQRQIFSSAPLFAGPFRCPDGMPAEDPARELGPRDPRPLRG